MDIKALDDKHQTVVEALIDADIEFHTLEDCNGDLVECMCFHLLIAQYLAAFSVKKHEKFKYNRVLERFRVLLAESQATSDAFELVHALLEEADHAKQA